MVGFYQDDVIVCGEAFDSKLDLEIINLCRSYLFV